MLLVAVAVPAAYCFAIEKIAYAPLRGSTRLVPLISAIGMSIFLQNWVAFGAGARVMAVPTLVTGSVRIESVDHFELNAAYSRLLIIVLTIVIMSLLSVYLHSARM